MHAVEEDPATPTRFSYEHGREMALLLNLLSAYNLKLKKYMAEEGQPLEPGIEFLKELRIFNPHSSYCISFMATDVSSFEGIPTF